MTSHGKKVLQCRYNYRVVLHKILIISTSSVFNSHRKEENGLTLWDFSWFLLPINHIKQWLSVTTEVWTDLKYIMSNVKLTTSD